MTNKNLMLSHKTEEINVEEIFREKNPRLFKLLPNFVFRYLKQIIHQDEFNTFLNNSRNDLSFQFITAALHYFDITVDCIGLKNIPQSGGCILVANHPLGGIDGIAILNGVSQRRRDIKALVNDLLLNLKNMSNLMIPTNKFGKNRTKNVKLLNQTYALNECLLVFPAGMVSRKQKGNILDLEWQKSFIIKAIQHQQVVIPIHVEARNSAFFYRLASIRKMLGIKTNLEMFYLVDEVYKQRGKNIKLTVGSPIQHNAFTTEHTPLVWAQKMKEHVYALKNNPNRHFL